jgi:hypothetical protein
MIGYGFAGIFRDILVRPPEMYVQRRSKVLAYTFLTLD